MATNTTNYGFKKPDESDFYDVADQNKNWDLADEALKNLDTPTFEDYTGSTAVPSATDAIDQIKSKGKLGTLLSNIKAAFKGACLIGHIVNNCVTDNAGLPLSAAQGKVLKDLYTQLYSDSQTTIEALNRIRYYGELRGETISELTSPSQLTHQGFYRFGTISSSVNVDAENNKIFSDYTVGDFHGYLLANNVDSTTGCTYGTLVLFSPRLNCNFWVGQIWNHKFSTWGHFLPVS